jgi:ubiquitin C-terminal hydrolase
LQAIFFLPGLTLTPGMDHLRSILRQPEANEPVLLYAACLKFFVDESPIQKNGTLLFPIGTQHDAVEFLEEMLDKIVSLGQNLETLKINEQTEHTCTTCKNSFPIAPATNLMLFVSLPPFQAPTKKRRVEQPISELGNLVNDVSKPSNTNKQCQHCDEDSPGVQKVEWTPSELLIIGLKRYDAQGRKNRSVVNTPLALKIKNQKFVLCSQLDHEGDSPTKGHYVTHVFRDGKVVTLDDMEIRAQPEGVNVRVSEKSYILFYKRVEVNNDEVQ